MELVLLTGVIGMVIIIVSLQFIPPGMYVKEVMTMANKTSNNFLSYYNPGFGIIIQYPSDWIIKDQQCSFLHQYDLCLFRTIHIRFPSLLCQNLLA